MSPPYLLIPFFLLPLTFLILSTTPTSAGLLAQAAIPSSIHYRPPGDAPPETGNCRDDEEGGCGPPYKADETDRVRRVGSGAAWFPRVFVSTLLGALIVLLLVGLGGRWAWGRKTRVEVQETGEAVTSAQMAEAEVSAA